MDIMLEQANGYSADYIKKIYGNFDAADSVIGNIRNNYNRRMHSADTKVYAPAFKMAFVHPELKQFVNSGKRDSVGNMPANTLLDTYAIEDADTKYHSIYQHPFVKVLEDLRAGTIFTSMEGQRLNAGEDSGSSSAATEEFRREMDNLVSAVDNGGTDGTNYTTSKCAKNMLARAGKKLNVAQTISNTIDEDSLFGFHRNAVSPKEWAKLEQFEHWYYYAFTMVPDADGKNTCSASVYQCVGLLQKFISENKDVVDTIAEIDRYYSQDEISGQDNDPQRSLNQLLALCVLKPSVVEAAVDAMRVDDATKKKYRDALGKLASLKTSMTKVFRRGGRNIEKVSMTQIQKEIDNYQQENVVSGDLLNALDGIRKSPRESMAKSLVSITSQFGRRNNKNGLSDASLFMMCTVFALLINNSSLMDGLLRQKPDSTESNDVVNNGADNVDDANTLEDLNNIEGEAAPSDASSEEYPDDSTQNSGDGTPFGRAAEYLGRGKNDEFTKILTDNTIAVREMFPDTSDVTGAYVLPDVAIPLFAQDISYPSTRTKTEGMLYRYAVTLTTYLTLLVKGNVGGLDTTPGWVSITRSTETGDADRPNAKKNNVVTGIQITGSKHDIILGNLNEDIRNCFYKFTRGRAANAIEDRNQWVSFLMDDQTWSLIALAVIRYFNTPEFNLSEKILDSLPKIMEDVRKHVLRNIFDVKDGCIDYIMPGKTTAISVKPLDPINHSSNGRLRKSGGIDGSVTAYGAKLLAKSRGKVTGVTTDENGQKFTVAFGNPHIPPDSIPSSKVDTWVPDALVDFEDPDNSSMHYAVWVGLQFCSIVNDEGTANTARLPEDVLNASNDVYSNSVGFSGSLTNEKKQPNEFDATKKLGITSSGVLTAVRNAASQLDPNKKSIYDNALASLTQALGICKENAPSISIANLLGDANEKAHEIRDALAIGICQTGGNETYVDADSYKSMGKLIAYCSQPGVDARVSAIRSLSALNALLGQSDDNVKAANMFYPFECTFGDNKVNIKVVDDLVNYKPNDPDEIEADLTAPKISREVIEDLQAAKEQLQYKMANIQDIQPDEVEGLVAMATQVMGELQEQYGQIMLTSVGLDDSGSASKVVKNARSAFQAISAPEFVAALTDVLSAIVPNVSDTPELRNASLVNIWGAMDSAVALGDRLVQQKPAKNIDEYNRGYGFDTPTRLHGEEYEDLPGMQIDENGETDYIDRDNLRSSIKGEMDEFDTETNENFSSVTHYPMLGMIKCDPNGMGSGQDNFDIEHGLNAAEFEHVASVLDDADMISARFDGVTAQNASSSEFLKSRNYSIVKFIDAFYPLMCNGMRIEDPRNHVIDNARWVGNAIRRIALACRDDSIRDELQECSNEFDSLVDNVAKRIPEQYDENVINTNLAAAGYIATAVANIVLYLASLDTGSVLSNAAGGLEQFGNPDNDRLGTGATDTYAAVHSMPDVSKGQSNARMLSTGISTPNKMFMDRINAGLNGADRFVKTLATFYTTFGMDKTAGYEDAINPFDDIVKKLDTKYTMGYRKLYQGETVTDLGAILVWAIVSDERRANGGYAQLQHVITTLANQSNEQPAMLDIPAYINEGLKTEDTEMGKKLNLGNMIQVFVSQDGKAMPVRNGDIPDNVRSDIGTFEGALDIWTAAKIGGNVNLTNESSAEDLARAVRVSIISKKLASNNAIKDLPSTTDNQGEDKYEPAVQNTIDTVKAAAASTKSSGEAFVPFSVVYASIDETYLNTAMSKVSESAHDMLLRKAQDSTYRDMFRKIYGDDGAESTSKAMFNNRNEIVYNLARALGDTTDGRLDADQRDIALNRQCVSTDPNADGGIEPDSSLNVLLGDKAGNVLDDFISTYGNRVNNDTTEEDLLNMAMHYVNRLFNPSGDLTAVCRALVDMASGNIEPDEGISLITSLIGAKSEVIANELYNQYLQMLGTPNNPQKAQRISAVKLRNVANRLVHATINSNSEVRNIYRASHGSDLGDTKEARMIMHGKAPLSPTEKIGGIGGTMKLYKKTAAALRGDMPEDVAAEYLSDVNFSIDKLRGQDALDKFNQICVSVKDGLLNLINSTLKALDPKKPADRELNKIGDTALDMKSAGPKRARILEQINKVLDSAKLSLNLRAPEKKVDNPDIQGTSMWDNNGLTNTVTTFINQNCSPDTDANSLKMYEDKSSREQASRELLNYVKNKFAEVFASGRLYQSGVEDIANVASMYRGVSSETKVSMDKAREILGMLSRIPASPIRESDNEIYGDYVIEGAPVKFNECIGIINDALDMYAKTEGAPKDIPAADIPVEDLVNPDFLECIRRCLSTDKDYAMSTDAMVELFMKTMISEKFLKRSNLMPYAMARYYTCKGADDQWHRYKFDFSLDVIRKYINEGMRGMKDIASTDKWEQFAADFKKYTSAGLRGRNDAIEDPALHNNLVELFNTVAKRMNGVMQKAAKAEEYRDIPSNTPTEIDEGVYMSRLGVNDAVPRTMAEKSDSDMQLNPRRDTISYNPAIPND